MSYRSYVRLPGLTVSVGSFLPRLRLPSVAGPMLAPADMVDEFALGVCIYNPAAVNPFPLPPRGVDLPGRLAMLAERNVTLYVISGLSLNRLASWLDLVEAPIHALSDEKGEFARAVGVPIKQVEGRNFRTHCAFVLQEDRILSILLETDPIHHFEDLLAALDVAEGKEPGEYRLADKPWYVDREQAAQFLEANGPGASANDDANGGK
ncbi:MAG: hypothetical protein D6775_06945 [Caldilineae bacterium]|nr:MAG: hypothetical protein D6775_06945 [Caldilineae bacterium]